MQMIIPILAWWLALQIIGIVGLPITSFFFRNLSLRGYLFNKTLSLLIVGYLSWLLALLGFGSFKPFAVILALVITGSVSAWVSTWREENESLTKYLSLTPAILLCEVFFFLTLLAGLWIRMNGAVGSAILGTEKPMDLAFLSGILQSPTFPPQDPWLAGFAINYYYLGYLLIAVLTVMSGVTVGQAFNLGVATIFALASSMVAGLLLAMIFKPDQRINKGQCASAFLALFLGLMLVLVVGNQAGALQMVFGPPKIVVLDDGQFADALSQRLAGINPIQIHPSVQTSPGDFGLISNIVNVPDMPFNWWWPSRFVWDTVDTDKAMLVRQYAITEFPFFSFFLGDLHPHVISLPFGLLGLAISFAVFELPVPPSFSGKKEETAILFLAAIVLGSLYMLNSWDAPTYILIFLGSLLFAHKRQAIVHKRHFDFKEAIFTSIQLLLVGIIAISPFVLTFQSFAGSRSVPEPWSRIPILGVFGKILAPASGHTFLYAFFGIFGINLIVLSFFWGRIEFAIRKSVTNFLGLLIVTVCAAFLGYRVGMPLLALLPYIAILVLTAWNKAANPVLSFFLWIISIGMIIIFVADIVYIRDPFENRMNTVFKLYYQAWIILNVMTAYAIWALLQPENRRHWSTVIWGPITFFLLAGGLVYPVQALTNGQRWAPYQDQLDGLMYYQLQAPDESAALQWIQSNTPPDAIILTAVGSSYDDTTGWVAAVTGRPTLLGWSGSHERLWRSGSPQVMLEISKREEEIPSVYMTTDWKEAQKILAAYHVDYIYIGPRESQIYNSPGLYKFKKFLPLVFEQGGVQIYEFNR